MSGIRGTSANSPSARPKADVAALYSTYGRSLSHQAERALPKYLRHEAEAAVMTVFTRLLDLEHQGKFPAPENWLAYLRRAVTNAAIDIVRRNRPATMVSLDAPEHHSDQDEHQIHATPGALTDPTGDAAVERVDNDRMLVRLRAALDGLPARQRTAVIGRMNERTLPDIGAELGVSGPRVSQMYNEALEQLRRELTRADA